MWKIDIINTGEDKASCPPQPLLNALFATLPWFLWGSQTQGILRLYFILEALKLWESQSIFACCPAPFLEFPYFLWKVPGISDTDFPGHFHIQSHPLLRRIYTNQDFRRTTEIPKIHFKETVLPISQILPAHIHSEVAWPQLILTEVAIAGDIWSKYPSPGLWLMPWSFTSYFMRDHQSDQPDHLSDHWSVINLHQEGSSCI